MTKRTPSPVKLLAALIAVLASFGLLAPLASAQTYAPDPPPVDCLDLTPPTIEIQGTDVVITFDQNTERCAIRVVVEVNPVLFDGLPPAGGVLRLPLPALEGSGHTVSVSVTTSFAEVIGEASAPISDATLALVAAKAGVSFTPTATGAPAVVAIAATPAAQPALAFTGSSAQLPAAVGAGLVGIGGLLVLAARKQRETESAI